MIKCANEERGEGFPNQQSWAKPGAALKTLSSLIDYESYPVITTLVRKQCENIITPPFQFDHLPTEVSKSLYRLKVSESAIIFAHLLRGLAPTDLFVSKKPKIWKFSIRVNFDTLTLKYQKSIFLKTFGLFGTCYEKMCPSFLWKTSSL